MDGHKPTLDCILSKFMLALDFIEILSSSRRPWGNGGQRHYLAEVPSQRNVAGGAG